MADSSFDVVSKIDRQEVDNALNQAAKEMSQRYDFRGTNTTIAWSGDEVIVITSDAEERAQAGLGVGFLADYTVRDDPAMVKLLPQQLRIPPLPMWLAVHREIRTNARIRAVYDFLADTLAPLL